MNRLPSFEEVAPCSLGLFELIITIRGYLSGEHPETAFVEGLLKFDLLINQIRVMLLDFSSVLVNVVLQFGCRELVLIQQRFIPSHVNRRYHVIPCYN